MPRDGSGIYTQPFPDVVPTTTIESAVYNGFVNDVETDLNAPRPIVAGGTGANNAYDAMIALKGEITGQQVTNYDSHVFVAGSFWSSAGATSAPNASEHFYGICYALNADALTIEARGYGTSQKFSRTRTSGGWSPWVLIQMANGIADADARYVNVTGDTVTGPLGVIGQLTVTQDANAVVRHNFLNPNAGSSAYNFIDLHNNAGVCGEIGVLSTTNPTYAGPGSMTVICTGAIGFFPNAAGELLRLNSGTVSISSTTASSSPATGALTVAGGVGVGGALHITGTGTINGGLLTINGPAGAGGGGRVDFQKAGAVKWYYGINSSITGGTSDDLLLWSTAGGAAIQVSHASATVSLPNTTASTSPSTGALTVAGGLGVGGTINTTGSITSASNVIVKGGTVQIQALNASNNSHIAYTDEGGTVAVFTYWNRTTGTYDIQFPGAPTTPSLIFSAGFGRVSLSLGYTSRNGMNGSYQAFNMNLHYNAAVYSFVDNTNMGQIQFVSDYRTKENVAELAPMWDTVKALRPIKYTHKNWTPPWELETRTKAAKESGVEIKPFFTGNELEQWGFIAHEMQDTLTETAATGHKDIEGMIQSPNPWTVIAALTKALQEAMARIEALEAA